MLSALLQSWRFWALLSAFCAALTAILAKVGVTGVPPTWRPSSAPW
jgi:transporter family protein